MSSDIERALEGVEDIRAWIETLWREHWRERGRRVTVTVTRKQVRRYLGEGLPHARLGHGPHTAAPSEVREWFLLHVAPTGEGNKGQ